MSKEIILSLLSLFIFTSCTNEIDLFIEHDTTEITTTSNETEANTENATDTTICTMEYDPVCGLIKTECGDTTPCDPIHQTFSNRCHAEAANATDITAGPCTSDQKPTPTPKPTEPLEEEAENQDTETSTETEETEETTE